MRACAHGWDEIGNRVFRLRCDTYQLNVAVVVGADGLMLVDTRASHFEGRALRADITRLSRAPVRWVVNTHVHYDHTFGNVEFVPPRQDPGAELWAHQNTIDDFASYAAAAKAELIEEGGTEATAMEAQVLVPPDHGFRGVATLSLGDREVELSYHGRGHTRGDIAVRVVDADVLIAGDLIREVGPPSHWADCFPLEWPQTLAGLTRIIGQGTAVLPGHGAVVGRLFVCAQQEQLRAVADEIVRLYQAGVPSSVAVREGSWPYESPRLQTAVDRGYQAMDSQLRDHRPC